MPNPPPDPDPIAPVRPADEWLDGFPDAHVPDAAPASGVIPTASPASGGDSQVIPTAAAADGSSVLLGHPVPDAAPVSDLSNVPLADPAHSAVQPAPPPADESPPRPPAPDPPPDAPANRLPDDFPAARPLFETPLDDLLPGRPVGPTFDAGPPPAAPPEPPLPVAPPPLPVAIPVGPPRPVDPGAFVAVAVVYVLLVGSSLGMALFDAVRGGRFTERTADEMRQARVGEIAAVESADTALVLVAWVLIARPVRRRPPAGRGVAWAVAGPLLAVLLAVNVGYHVGLRAVVGEAVPDLFGWKDGWLALLLICVQPAVVEELFFRHLMLGHLRGLLGTHAAVWVTAVLFGVAHFGAWVSVPILVAAGVGLGYARVYSGGLTLPIVLHFLHNLAVTYANHVIDG